MSVTESDWNDHAAERAAAAGGNQAAWAALFLWLWPWTLQLAGSADGAQAGWLKVVRNQSLWLRPLGFFAVIFKNAGRDDGRKERRHQRRVAALFTANRVGVRHGAAAELKEIIAQAVGRLLPDHRRDIELWVEGYSTSDISEMCGISYSTARRRLKDALAALKAALGLETADRVLIAPLIVPRLEMTRLQEIDNERSKNNS